MSGESGETRIRLTTHAAEETERLGETIALTVQAPVVLALDGELGAGKTQCVRGAAKGLGLDSKEIASPTFVICTRHEGATDLAHVDAYRIESLEELETIGFQEMIQESGLVMAIEWASRIHEALPEDRLEVRIAHRGETSRGIEIIDHRNDASQRQRLADTLVDLFEAKVVTVDRGTACPSCGRTGEKDAGMHKPFCSARCRLIDLGNWLGGYYSISRDINADEELSD
jgi:tRNA threonylcarbamoyladenosine biosynthesis protein TsaE